MRFYGGIPVFYRLRVSDGKWEVDVDDLRRKAEGCKAVVVINPNNPTGGVFDKHDLEVIAEVAAEYNMVIISDKIYDRIVFGDGFQSMALLAKDAPVIGLNGFSKTLLVTG